MVHEFDLALWMVGEIIEVNAWGSSPTRPQLREIGDAQVACVQLRFANRAIGVLDGTMLAPHGVDCYTEVLGATGVMRVGFGSHAADLALLAAGQAQVGFPTDFRERFCDAFVGEIEHFANAILENRRPDVDGHDGLAASAVAEAAGESFVSGRVTRVRPVSAAIGAGP